MKRPRWHRGEYRHYAVLVECKRIDGKPKQRFIKHLGTICDYQLENLSNGNRFSFWDTADKALAELALDDDDRQAIEGKLLAVVPRPDPEAVAGRNHVLEALAENPELGYSERVALFNEGCSAYKTNQVSVS